MSHHKHSETAVRLPRRISEVLLIYYQSDHEQVNQLPSQ